MAIAQGTVVFDWDPTRKNTFQGQETNQFKLTVSLAEDTASVLEDAGVKVKEYEGTKQRHFTSQYPVKVIDVNDQPFQGSIPRGSVVRVLFKVGDKPHPQHGTPVYMNAVRVVTLAEPSLEDFGDL